MGVGSHVWLVAGVAAVSLSSGCADDGGGGGAGAANAGGAGGGASTESWIVGECGACVVSQCSEAIAACESDPGCAGYWSCLQDCPPNALNGDADGDCEAACVSSESSEALELRVKVQGCRFFGDGATECPACGVVPITELPDSPQSCGRFVPPERIETPTACQEQFFDSCCETWSALIADPDAVASGDCMTTCTDIACVDACLPDAPSTQVFLDQFACGRVYCAGDQDDCVASERNDCEHCTYETCAEQWEAVLLSRDAFLLWACPVFECADEDYSVECIDGCFDAYPGGEELNLLWLECVSAQCSTCEGA